MLERPQRRAYLCAAHAAGFALLDNLRHKLARPLPDAVLVQGLADDLEAAKSAFKTNWEKLLAAVMARP